MSQGDKLTSIPTIYNGIQMRSKLESKIAFFLDSLKIIWIYEPQLFQLSNGIMYKPDFFLPELNMWIEVKGLIEEHNESISETFVRDNKTELILFSAKDIYWYSAKDSEFEISKDKTIQLGKCEKCSKYFFCSNLGSYHCRHCFNHEGDHNIICSFDNDSFYWKNKSINFSDLDFIKELVSKLRS